MIVYPNGQTALLCVGREGYKPNLNAQNVIVNEAIKNKIKFLTTYASRLIPPAIAPNTIIVIIKESIVRNILKGNVVSFENF